MEQDLCTSGHACDHIRVGWLLLCPTRGLCGWTQYFAPLGVSECDEIITNNGVIMRSLQDKGKWRSRTSSFFTVVFPKESSLGLGTAQLRPQKASLSIRGFEVYAPIPTRIFASPAPSFKFHPIRNLKEELGGGSATQC